MKLSANNIVKTIKITAAGLFLTNEVVKLTTNTIKLKRQLALQEFEDESLRIKYKNMGLVTPVDISKRIEKRKAK